MRLNIRWKLFLSIVGPVLALALIGLSQGDTWLSSPSIDKYAFAVAGLLVLLSVSSYLVGAHLSRPVRRLMDAVDRLGKGDFSTRTESSARRDEIGELSRAFNEMVSELEFHVQELTSATAAREAVEGELRAAREIQASLLPQVFPAFPDRDEFELHAVNAPARHVGGDFFDFFLSSEHELVLVIADVSGKGVPAAMLMAVSRTVVRNLAMDGLAPAEILAETNRLLLEDNIGSMYVTLFVARYDTRNGCFSYANGAHLPPLKVGTDNAVTAVGAATGTVVGILEDCTFEQESGKLEVGELLALYTDGVTEARSPSGEFYGDEPIRRLLSAYSDAPPNFLCDLIVREANAFQGGERTDDLTLLLLRRLR